MTFTATANVVVHLGARPVFVDIERNTMNIDPARIEAAITPRTKVIMPVHMAGRPCELDAINEIAKRHRLHVVEDAAHAIETVYRGRKVGSISDISVFSFYVTKNLCTGEGGMVTTENDEWGQELRIKSLHGMDNDAWKRYSSEGYRTYETVYPGYKYNMMDIQASLGLHQLERIEKNLTLRERYWAMYDEAFANMPELITPSSALPPDSRHARHLYSLLLDLDRLKIDRNQFIHALQKENIGVGVHFTALHLHKYYRETYGYSPGDFPTTEWVGERTISLPLSARLADEDVASVIHAVRRIARYYRR
jgi:dTDP-4-amino-4,6-dideoxygalactose transaminase